MPILLMQAVVWWGSYVDADDIYHPYVRTPDGRFISIDLPQAATFEYFFVHGINDVGDSRWSNQKGG